MTRCTRTSPDDNTKMEQLYNNNNNFNNHHNFLRRGGGGGAVYTYNKTLVSLAALRTK